MKAEVSSCLMTFIVEWVICILNSLSLFLFCFTKHCSWHLRAHCLQLDKVTEGENFVHSCRKRGSEKHRKVKAHCWNHRNSCLLSWEQICGWVVSWRAVSCFEQFLLLPSWTSLLKLCSRSQIIHNWKSSIPEYQRLRFDWWFDHECSF